MMCPPRVEAVRIATKAVPMGTALMMLAGKRTVRLGRPPVHAAEVHLAIVADESSWTRFVRVEQRALGRSGLKISRLGLGTMTWGNGTDPDEAAAILVAFHDAGGTFVDTAISYSDGEAERILGGLIADVVPRSDLLIASKAGITRSSTERWVDTSRGTLLRRLD